MILCDRLRYNKVIDSVTMTTSFSNLNENEKDDDPLESGAMFVVEMIPQQIHQITAVCQLLVDHLHTRGH